MSVVCRASCVIVCCVVAMSADFSRECYTTNMLLRLHQHGRSYSATSWSQSGAAAGAGAVDGSMDGSWSC